MTDLRMLHEAFEALERQADTMPAARPVAPRRPALLRWGAPLAAAAVVAGAAMTAALLWPRSTPAVSAHSATSDSPAPHLSAAASHDATTQPTEYRPPETIVALTAKARSILGGTASLTIDRSRSSNRGAEVIEPGVGGIGESGAALGGTLTAGRHSGGFALAVYADTPGTAAVCDLDQQHCTVTTRDGGSLAVDTWRDPTVPGGVTYEVEYVRSDGATVLFHLSTEANPKGASAVTSTDVPLTVDQMIVIATSAQW